MDGPGNRTAVFLQGCNINCKYCHNPETRKECISCGLCVEKCPAHALSFREGGSPGLPLPAADSNTGSLSTGSVIGSSAAPGNGFTADSGRKVVWDPELCCQCDTCIHVCPHDASPRVRWMTPEEVMRKVEHQIPFIRGVSVSGGECTLHPDFLTEFFRLAKAENLGTLIDSNGMILFEDYPELMEVSDGVMLDIKAFDPEDYRRVTDADNTNVLRNALWLGKHGKLEEVRFVIVPDLYDTEGSVRKSGEFLRDVYRIKPFRIKLIAYRPMGVREQYSHYQVPSQEYLGHLRDILSGMGYEDIVLI